MILDPLAYTDHSVVHDIRRLQDVPCLACTADRHALRLRVGAILGVAELRDESELVLTVEVPDRNSGTGDPGRLCPRHGDDRGVAVGVALDLAEPQSVHVRHWGRA